MIPHIFYFVLGIIGPYIFEQYAYSKFIPGGHKQGKKDAETVSQSYGWRLIWDAAYFLLFIRAAYRIIVLIAPLSILEWLGYFCFLFGVLLRIWSLKEIGRFYNPGIVIKADHEMIHTGPYRILRHPLHMGTLLQIIGLACFAPIWLALPAMIASLWLCLYLNRTEDRTHSKMLGTAFHSYYLKTWDIIDLFFWKVR
jgi:protein-S-isoprenylcysteine O-methyltransferase Ste14